ncbi:MAG: aa3-type cytochrome c oxidase subunit IV [Ferrovibrio sp.]
MAEEHKMGTMDISQHKAAYNGFMKMTTWGCVTVAVLLALMAFFLVRGHH